MLPQLTALLTAGVLAAVPPAPPRGDAQGPGDSIPSPVAGPMPEPAPASLRLLPSPAAVELLAVRRAGAPPEGAGTQADSPQLVEYSDGYFTRLTIHRWASYLTLPMFAAEWYLGNKLYNGTATSTTRSAHGAVATGLGVLFAVNTVTGGLNLWEARKDPEGRALRTVHGVLMLLADAGFAATGATAPESEEGRVEGNPSLHRSLAIGSIAAATVSYLIMLPPFRRD